MKKILGIILLPLLRPSWFFLVILSTLLFKKPVNMNWSDYSFVALMMSIIPAAVMGFIYGNCGLMNPISKGLVKLFNCEFEYSYRNQMLHSHCVWESGVLKMKGKQIDTSIVSMGGNLYEPDTTIRLRVIFWYLFNF